MTTTLAYQALSARLPRTLETLAKRPDIKRETEYFSAKIGGVKSAADLVADQRLYSYVLKAFGLSDMAFGRALIRKVLEEGVEKRESLGNRLVDQRFRSLAQAFNFPRYGAGATTLDSARQGTVDRFVRLTLEEEAGRDNEGVRLALNFDRKAGQLTSIYGLLADKALLQVTRTALQLPDAFSSLDIDKQADVLSKKIDIASFKTAEGRGKFLKRFTALWDVSQPASPPISFGASLAITSSPAGISSGVLQTIQSLRQNGR